MKYLPDPLAGSAGAALLALVVAAPAAAQTAADGGPGAECDARFQPADVRIQDSAVTVAADLSQPVDTVTQVAPQDSSGLVVQSVDTPARSEKGQAPDLALTLDTSDAVAGEWTVKIEASSKTCTGTLAVQRPQQARQPSLFD